LIKKRATLIILTFLLLFILSNTQKVDSIADQGTLKGQFVTGNVAPPAFQNLSIQDGPSSWDNTSLDTHDISPNLRWLNGSDDNGDSISTHLCIANSTVFIQQFLYENNSGNCTYAADISAGTYSISDVPNLYFNSTNRTYLITLIPDDGLQNGTELNATLYFLDSRPYVSSLNITEVHTQTPVISWSVEDNDTGGVNQWPQDTLYHYLYIGNNSNLTAYFINISADNDSTQITTELPWGDAGADWANRTINITIWADDTNLTSENYTTSFTLYDYLPHINNVQMVDTGDFGGPCQTDGSYCALTPVEHSNATVAVRLNVTDLDNDCSAANHEAWIMLCWNTTGNQNCDETWYNFSWEIDTVEAGNTDECIFTFSANKTASDGTPEFFRIPGMYKLNINVTSQAGERTNQSYSNASWQFGTLKAVDYATTLILGGGNPTLGQWNDGTDLYTMTNWGNDILALDWNASDPTMGTDTWELNGTDFAIDDDADHTDDTDNLEWVFLNATTKYFNYSTGLERCIAWACDDASTNETLPTYYHIAPPLNLHAGTYNTSITLTLTSKY
jgi:hypothetical protein